MGLKEKIETLVAEQKANRKKGINRKDYDPEDNMPITTNHKNTLTPWTVSNRIKLTEELSKLKGSEAREYWEKNRNEILSTNETTLTKDQILEELKKLQGPDRRKFWEQYREYLK